ncbi:LPS export ABC transporter periplasmic protein LptC [Candidatus Babeliales bacterium]|nr:LPS export ABC transporter periplasmic protein LptC [Candidatus Babeliales bacterium]
MRLKNKTILLTFISIIILTLLHFLKNKTKEEASLSEAIQETNAISKTVTLHQIAPDKKKGFSISAEEAIMHKNKKHHENIICKNVTCTFITEKNTPAHLYSVKTTFNTETKNLFLENTVTGTVNNINLKGSNFNYDFNKQTIKSKEKATLSHPRFNIYSNKTEIKLKDKVVKLDGGIKSEFFISSPTNSNRS